MTTSSQWFEAARVLHEHADKLTTLGKHELLVEDAARAENADDAPRIVAAVRQALTELEEAYARREHGGVAQDQCIRKIKEAVE